MFFLFGIAVLPSLPGGGVVGGEIGAPGGGCELLELYNHRVWGLQSWPGFVP